EGRFVFCHKLLLLFGGACMEWKNCGEGRGKGKNSKARFYVHGFRSEVGWPGPRLKQQRLFRCGPEKHRVHPGAAGKSSRPMENGNSKCLNHREKCFTPRRGCLSHRGHSAGGYSGVYALKFLTSAEGGMQNERPPRHVDLPLHRGGFAPSAQS